MVYSPMESFFNYSWTFCSERMVILETNMIPNAVFPELTAGINPNGRFQAIPMGDFEVLGGSKHTNQIPIVVVVPSSSKHVRVREKLQLGCHQVSVKVSHCTRFKITVIPSGPLFFLMIDCTLCFSVRFAKVSDESILDEEEKAQEEVALRLQQLELDLQVGRS